MSPAIDWTDAFEKHRGKWVAFKSDRQTVAGYGDSLKAAKKDAAGKGCRNPIITRMPSELQHFIGQAR
jgi:hypothetical protein